MSDEISLVDWNTCQLDVERLCNNDRHADALELLDRVDIEATAIQPDIVPDIQELITQVENRQNQRCTTIFTKQIQPYLDLKKVDTSGELTEILKTPKQIDPKRAKTEMDQKLQRLENNSPSHFQYSAIKSGVDKHLKRATSIVRLEDADSVRFYCPKQNSHTGSIFRNGWTQIGDARMAKSRYDIMRVSDMCHLASERDSRRN